MNGNVHLQQSDFQLPRTVGATTLIGNLYSYNNANNISSWTTATTQKATTYDAVNRLTAASDFEIPAENYNYDDVGNRTTSLLSGNYVYQPFNKLTSTATVTLLTFSSVMVRVDTAMVIRKWV